MKVVVTSTGEGLNSQVDPRFGRAAMFVMIDTETGETRAQVEGRAVVEVGGDAADDIRALWDSVQQWLEGSWQAATRVGGRG